MPIGAGDLDRKIVIQRSTEVPNEFNEPVLTWLDFVSRRALRRDVSDGEKFAAGQVGSSLAARFVIRSDTQTRTVTPVDRLMHEGHVWSIHGVKEADEGRFRFIEITAVKDSD
ncbi:head-tail adaptor protein [Sinorhizobium meliloti]|uniref:head-tail adaptor protein n=1 Tax=Rhizobium meliloti TaxID=382 RepID=UPI00238083B1|nr:head-tail adaptor protein [Sinorhizobium meliloti]MDE3797599.1 head-tail adaptor protein [Sinorhizobium meliloti]